MNITARNINTTIILFILILSGCQSIGNKEIVLEDGGTGYYKAVAIENDSLPGYTIFTPGKLDYFGDKQKLPVVLWLNKNCTNNSEGLENLLNEIASYGYIVIAADSYVILSQPEKEKQTLFPAVLDWLRNENSSKSSDYYNKIDITKVAIAGL